MQGLPTKYLQQPEPLLGEGCITGTRQLWLRCQALICSWAQEKGYCPDLWAPGCLVSAGPAHRTNTLLPTPSPVKLVHESHWPTQKDWEYFAHHGSPWLQPAVDPAAATPRPHHNYHFPQCHFSTGQIPRLTSQALPVTSFSVAAPAPALCHRHGGCHRLPCGSGLVVVPSPKLVPWEIFRRAPSLGQRKAKGKEWLVVCGGPQGSRKQGNPTTLRRKLPFADAANFAF